MISFTDLMIATIKVRALKQWAIQVNLRHTTEYCCYNWSSTPTAMEENFKVNFVLLFEKNSVISYFLKCSLKELLIIDGWSNTHSRNSVLLCTNELNLCYFSKIFVSCCSNKFGILGFLLKRLGKNVLWGHFWF